MTLLEQMITGEAPKFVPLTVGQYHEMIAQGILREGEPIELIDGILVRKDRADRGGSPMSHGPRHSFAVGGLQDSFDGVKAAGCHVRIQLPVTISDTQEPEPDATVIRGMRQEFAARHPGPVDVVALMEVSDSSLAFDRTTKLRLYAAAAIPVYWIVNLQAGQVEVYQEPLPAEGRYGRRTDYLPGDMVPLVIGPGFEIQVAVVHVVPAAP
jgi:Uma2 family endonuclease